MNTPAKQHADASPADSLGRVRELGHVVLYVTDLDRSLAFYRDILGWPVVHQPPGLFRYAGFRAGNTHHDLLLIEVGPDAAPVPPSTCTTPTATRSSCTSTCPARTGTPQPPSAPPAGRSACNTKRCFRCG